MYHKRSSFIRRGAPLPIPCGPLPYIKGRGRFYNRNYPTFLINFRSSLSALRLTRENGSRSLASLFYRFIALYMAENY